MSKYILAYVREEKEDIIYAKRLALSMHLAYSDDGKHFLPFNHNSGVLFATADSNSDGTINAKSLRSPWIFSMKDGQYGVVAIRTMSEGEPEPENSGKVLFWTSKDLLQYKWEGFIELPEKVIPEKIQCEFQSSSDRYVLKWLDKDKNCGACTFENLTANVKGVIESYDNTYSSDLDTLDITEIEGCIPTCKLEVPEDIVNRMKIYLLTPENCNIIIKNDVKVSSPDDMNKITAVAEYTDGSSCQKRVDWDTKSIDWSVKGIKKISGKVHQEHCEFPFAINRADPCVGAWNGKYYFIATNDADSNHSLFIREADSVHALMTADETLILNSEMYEDAKGLLWAPEFHIVENDLYIFFACTTGPFFCEESHVMHLKHGGNPMNIDDWEKPQFVVKKDGTPIAEAGKVITLDMTCWEWNSEYYIAWSQRQFLPVDQGAWLYIAKVDAKEPWKLISDPIVLSKPDYGWGNNHTFVEEGPFTLISDDRIYLTFSGAAVDATYTVGVLYAEKGADLLDIAQWTKCNYPLLTSRSIDGEFGPGHNAYVIDEFGQVWNTYHARPGVEAPRSSGIRRVHFNVEGFPVLDMQEKQDVNPELADVTCTVEIL